MTVWAGAEAGRRLSLALPSSLPQVTEEKTVLAWLAQLLPPTPPLPPPHSGSRISVESLTEGFYFVNKVSAPAVSYRELIGDEGG